MAENENKTEYKKRQTAFKIKIKDISEGKFVKEDNLLNSVETVIGVISRVNIIGFIVANETSDFFSGVVLDDGTGRISVRSFEKKTFFENLGIGDAVNIIGRVRLYGDQKYISAEAVQKVDRKWLEHRKKELFVLEKVYKKFAQEITKFADSKQERLTEEEVVDSESKSEVDKIIKLIREYDSGNGANIDVIVKSSNSQNCEKIIEELLKNGDIFEILPGKIKILE